MLREKMIGNSQIEKINEEIKKKESDIKHLRKQTDLLLERLERLTGTFEKEKISFAEQIEFMKRDHDVYQFSMAQIIEGKDQLNYSI